MAQELEKQLSEVKAAVESWISKQGHDSCWYYPEIFRKIANILGVKYTEPNLPPRAEFEAGCARYQGEVYPIKK